MSPNGFVTLDCRCAILHIESFCNSIFSVPVPDADECFLHPAFFFKSGVFFLIFDFLNRQQTIDHHIKPVRRKSLVCNRIISMLFHYNRTLRYFQSKKKKRSEYIIRSTSPMSITAAFFCRRSEIAS